MIRDLRTLDKSKLSHMTKNKKFEDNLQGEMEKPRHKSLSKYGNTKDILINIIK